MRFGNNLYEAILSRASKRRYERQPLDEDILAQLLPITSRIKPLIHENKFDMLVQNVEPGENLVEKVGGYGRIVNPPHYLVPYLVGKHHSLVDLGCRVEQIVIHLTSMGMGTCYLGCIQRQDEVRRIHSLPEEAVIGAFLIFGKPSKSLGGKAVNTLIHSIAGADNKLPLEKIFFVENFDNPSTPPDEISTLVEAARRSPSAVNAQPWRFLWQDGRLYLFITRHNKRYGNSQDYRFYDSGICIGNITLALEAQGKYGNWTLYDGDEPGIPEHPDDLEPLASLSIL